MLSTDNAQIDKPSLLSPPLPPKERTVLMNDSQKKVIIKIMWKIVKEIFIGH